MVVVWNEVDDLCYVKFKITQTNKLYFYGFEGPEERIKSYYEYDITVLDANQIQKFY